MMIENERITLEIMHLDHRLWKNKLDFFQDEIAIFEHRLEDLVNKSQDKEMMAGLEHFQNQFIRQKEVLDILQHDIGEHEHTVVQLVKKESITSEADEIMAHQKMKERMDQFDKIYGELKTKFYTFLRKWK